MSNRRGRILALPVPLFGTGVVSAIAPQAQAQGVSMAKIIRALGVGASSIARASVWHDEQAAEQTIA